jgi:hypothetical protein
MVAPRPLPAAVMSMCLYGLLEVLLVARSETDYTV